MSEENEDDAEETDEDDAEGLGSDGTFGDLDGDEDDDFDDGDDEDGKPAGGGKKKLIAIIAGVVVLLVLGGGGIAYFLGGSGGSQTAELVLGTPVTYELPQLKADLKTGRCRSPFLRIIIAIQLNSDDLSVLQQVEMKVLDRVQMHLREQERQDLVGKDGSNRLRLDIANFVNNTIAPARVTAVLFKEFLLQ